MGNVEYISNLRQRRTRFDYYISSVKDKQLKDKAAEISQDKCYGYFISFIYFYLLHQLFFMTY